MAKKAGTFDIEGFYRALDAERQSRQLNWKQVATESGVSASTLTRMAQRKKPDVDSLSALISWSGLDTCDFISGAKGTAASGFAQSLVLLRSDSHLSKKSAEMLEDLLKVAYERFREG